MRVADLEGDALDLWVAKAWMGRGAYATVDASYIRDYEFHPSTNWEQAGPIIEGARIAFAQLVPHFHQTLGIWEAQVDGVSTEQPGLDGTAGAYGPTQLVAAMRALVKSKFGEEVKDIDAPQSAGLIDVRQ